MTRNSTPKPILGQFVCPFFLAETPHNFHTSLRRDSPDYPPFEAVRAVTYFRPLERVRCGE